MARDKGQVFIFNDAELSLIKAVFADNEELLYAIRKVLLQFELTKDEKKMVKAAVNKEVFNILKKRIFPDASSDAPFGQIADIYQTLTNDLKSKTPEEMKPLLEAKALEAEYLEQQFKQLEDLDSPVKQNIVLENMKDLVDKDYRQAFVETTARNFLLGYIDPMLLMIQSIAGQKTESVEETKKRMSRNSSK